MGCGCLRPPPGTKVPRTRSAGGGGPSYRGGPWSQPMHPTAAQLCSGRPGAVSLGDTHIWGRSYRTWCVVDLTFKSEGSFSVPACEFSRQLSRPRPEQKPARPCAVCTQQCPGAEWLGGGTGVLELETRKGTGVSGREAGVSGQQARGSGWVLGSRLEPH